MCYILFLFCAPEAIKLKSTTEKKASTFLDLKACSVANERLRRFFFIPSTKRKSICRNLMLVNDIFHSFFLVSCELRFCMWATCLIFGDCSQFQCSYKMPFVRRSKKNQNRSEQRHLSFHHQFSIQQNFCLWFQSHFMAMLCLTLPYLAIPYHVLCMPCFKRWTCRLNNECKKKTKRYPQKEHFCKCT